MELSDEDRIARGRFFVLILARLGGVVLVMLGIAIWQADLVVDGGSAPIGVPVFLLGLAESVFLPKMLASKWRTPGER